MAAARKGKRKRKRSLKAKDDVDVNQQQQQQEETGPDLVSSLPHCLLTSILSLLPIQDCFRTAVLSSQWRHLWTHAPLQISHYSFTPFKSKKKKKKTDQITYFRSDEESIYYEKAINNIFFRHRGPILSFQLWPALASQLGTSLRSWDLLRAPYRNWPQFDRTLDRWIGILSRKGIINLTLYYTLPPRLLDCHTLTSLVIASLHSKDPLILPPNLRELMLVRCTLSETEPFVAPAKLRKIEISSCKLSSDQLSNILSTCKVLEELRLFDCFAFELVRISSPTLKKLRFTCSASEFLSKILIRNSPNLKFLELNGIVKVINTESYNDWLFQHGNASIQFQEDF